MDDYLIYALVILHITIIFQLMKKRRKVKRRWSVRPINQQRDSLGEFETLFQEIKKDSNYFFKYTLMNLQTFNKLFKKVTPLLLKRSHRKPLCPEQRLAITLKFLASGCDTFTLASSFRVGESTVRNVIAETSIAIIKVLAPKYLKPPTYEDWLRYCKGFERDWNLPNCGGAVDGKHITIRAPPNSGSLFFNYKKTYSIVLMAVCDHEYKFSLVEIGAFGSSNDAGIFEDSELSADLFNSELNLPENLMILSHSNIATPCYLAADDAFPLSTRLMKPYPGSYLNEPKSIFNYRLFRGRRVIENTFGILASRWRIFYRPVAMAPEKMNNVVMATICLHNMLMTENIKCQEDERMYCPPNFVDRDTQNGRTRLVKIYYFTEFYIFSQNIRFLGDWRFNGEDQLLRFPSRTGRHSTREAHRMRDSLATYFESPAASVPWQLDYVRRGQNRE